MFFGTRMQVFLAVIVFLMLCLAVFWPWHDEDNPLPLQQDFPPKITTEVQTPFGYVDSIHSIHTPINPFAKNNVKPLKSLDIVVNNKQTKTTERNTFETSQIDDEMTVTDESPSNHPGQSNDWGQWRNPDERLYNYLGGPPGPGSRPD